MCSNFQNKSRCASLAMGRILLPRVAMCFQQLRRKGYGLHACSGSVLVCDHAPSPSSKAETTASPNY